jgi:hypothetical protein
MDGVSPPALDPPPARMHAASGGGWIASLRSRWSRYGGVVLAVAAGHALLTAVLRLTGAFDALVFAPDGPIDLLIRTDEVRRWFAGVTIYGDPASANYPPASYTLLWPLVGWLPERTTRALYAGSILASMATIAVVAVRASGARSIPERAFMSLFVLPLGATQITVWIGQLGLHVVACLLGATALLFGTGTTANGPRTGGRGTWPTDLAAAALIAASLVKPTLSVPVVAVILIVAWRWRPAVLAAVIYIGATLLAAAFQEHSAPGLVLMWLGRESVMNLPLGSVNTHLWLHWLGVEGSKLHASLLWLLAVAVWAWRYRHLDPWIVVGVAALVGRLWIHHRAFDDVLLVIPAIALFRIATIWGPRSSAVPLVGSLLLAAIYGLGHAPYAYLSGASPVLWLITEAGRTVAWAAALGFLLWHAHRFASGRRESHAPLAS